MTGTTSHSNILHLLLRQFLDAMAGAEQGPAKRQHDSGDGQREEDRGAQDVAETPLGAIPGNRDLPRQFDGHGMIAPGERSRDGRVVLPRRRCRVGALQRKAQALHSRLEPAAASQSKLDALRG